MGYGVPDMTAVRSGVHLSTLSATENGDVFYVVTEPRTVYRRNKAGGARGVEFQVLGMEQWYEQEQLGNPGDRVVVLHNTRKFSEKLAEGEGPD